MDKIGLKRIKRRKRVADRLKCHRNKMACGKVHSKKQKILPVKPIVKVIKKSLWQRIKEFLRWNY